MPEPRRYQNYIDGRWCDAADGGTFEDRNPADQSDVVGRFPRSSRVDVERAVAAAVAAFPAWRRVPAPKRAAIVQRAGELMAADKEAISRTMTREMGKVLAETRGDTQEGIDAAVYVAGEGRRLYGKVTPSELPDKLCFAIRQPVGPCAIITPWNFPMAIPTWKIFPALVCGNTLAWKPAEDTPATATRFVELLVEAGVPRGVVNLVHGDGPGVGQPLATHPAIRCVSFTGSSDVGRLLTRETAPGLTKLALELGGKNAQIVMADADLDLALEGAVWGAFGTTGQRCTATSRLLLHRDIHDAFVERLVARARALRVGNGLDAATEMGPLVNAEQRARVLEYVRVGTAEGATLRCGGRALEGGAHARGHFVEPTVFTGVTPAMRIFREEIFGPVVAVTAVDSFDHAIDTCNDSAYGLSSSIYTADVTRAFRAIDRIEAGITYVNGPTIGAEVHLPFGGVKATGNGHREGGWTVLDIFSEWKAVYVDYSGRLQKAQIDTEALTQLG
jgi:aldehyde dehydrogenase (NAD+)